MIDVLGQAASLGGSEGLPGSDRAAMVTVIRVAGSVPRRPGAKMIVHTDGRLISTVGGGRVENDVVQVARAVASGAGPAQRWCVHLVRDLAMCCGGEMELWIEPIDALRAPALTQVVRARAARTPVVLRTALEAPGGKQIVPSESEDECLRTRRPRLEAGAFFEPVLPPARLVIFGSGHIAAAIAPLAAAVGFEVVISDDNEAQASAARFPAAARVLDSFDPAEVEPLLGSLAGDYVLIATRDHAVDQSLLERLLGRADLAFIGMVGSRGKLGRFRRRLEARGIGDDAAWARLRSPVGLPIGAETPEEIAVAIVAELVQTRARGSSPPWPSPSPSADAAFLSRG